jgi:hypothetical protein
MADANASQPRASLTLPRVSRRLENARRALPRVSHAKSRAKFTQPHVSVALARANRPLPRARRALARVNYPLERANQALERFILSVIQKSLPSVFHPCSSVAKKCFPPHFRLGISLTPANLRRVVSQAGINH